MIFVWIFAFLVGIALIIWGATIRGRLDQAERAFCLTLPSAASKFSAA
jgi:hypothetical protein